MATKSQKPGSLDPNQIRAFNSFYRSLAEKPSTTIRFFSRNDFYTVHGTDAIFTAKEFFKTTSFVKTYASGNDSLESLYLNKANFEAFVRELLLVKHYRVEVYFSKGGHKNNNWALEYKGSPGNLSQFEDILFENVSQAEGTAIISIKLGTDANSKTPIRMIGIALVDSTEQRMSLCEFVDDEYFSNTEALIVQLAAKECILMSEKNYEMDKLKKIVERSGILLTLKKKADFSADSLIQDMNRLIKFKEGQQQNVMSLPQMSLTVASGALSAIIKYLDLTSNQENFSQYDVATIEHQKFVHIDAAAMDALSLLPSKTSVNQSKHHSVFGLLDRCRTAHGHRLLMQWVRQPLRDLGAINERADIVETLFRNPNVRQELHDEHLRKIPDLQCLAKKLQRKKASIQDCYRIYQGILKLPALLKTLQSCNDHNPHPTMQSVFIVTLEEQVADVEKFREMVETTLDLDLVDRGEYLIKSEFDETLQEMRKKMCNIESKMKSQLSKVAAALGLQENKAIKLETTPQFGHFFRVTLKDAKIIQRNKEYELLDTNKGGVKFRNSALTELNDQYTSIYKQYDEHQKSIVADVMEVAVGYCSCLNYLSFLLASLDVLTSFAVVAACAPIPYVRPQMMPMGSGTFTVQQARHACVEVQDSVSFIPNDVFFKQDECTLHIITGPNMGGKSTYIRSIGVIALLAHIGSFIPCESAIIPVLDTIMARVGANDSQIRGMSTFMIEMVETSTMVRRATSNSLVIIDELGRGTSTYEGCGIASAIIEHLSEKLKSFTLFATHFHELTLLALEIPTIQNLYVSAITADDKLTHLYQLKKGFCDQSFGIHVAKMSKFPSDVVQDAENRLNELDDFLILDNVDISEDEKLRTIKEGNHIIEEFLKSCKQLQKEEDVDEEFEHKVKRLKQSVIDNNNPYVNALLNKKSKQ